jgi:undecaprenyl-diphosphatase
MKPGYSSGPTLAPSSLLAVSCCLQYFAIWHASVNLDQWILLHLNSLARHSQVFDEVMALFAGRTLLKGGVIFALFWASWFDVSKEQYERRTILLSGFFAAIISLAISRLIATLAPFRERPLWSLAHFQVPYATSSEDLIHWSSFPSDHAALYVGLSVAILLAWRRLGILALVYTLVFICVPRMYVGIHYPSDLLAGALIGTVVVLVATTSAIKQRVKRLLRYESQNPAVFYMISFFVTAQLVEMFIDVRKLAVFVWHAIAS